MLISKFGVVPSQSKLALTYTNLLSNPSFEDATISPWSLEQNTLVGGSLTTTNPKFGTQCFTISGNNQGFAIYKTGNFSFSANDKIYYSFWTRRTGTSATLYPEAGYIMDNTTTLSTISNADYQGNWVFLSSLITISASSSTIFLKIVRGSGSIAGAFDGITFLNLTSIYGAGSEPSKSAMDNLMQNTFGGYINGSVVA